MATRISQSRYFLRGALALFLLSCNMLGVPQQPVETAAAPSPEGTSEDVQMEGVLFQDDFSDPASGVWNVNQSDTIIREYIDGEFRTFVNNDEFSYSYPPALTQQSFGDVRIEVDVRRVSGADDASAYLLCRRQAERQYIFGDVDFEGEARIGLVSGELQEILADEEGIAGLQEGVNHLRLDCIANAISLYANGNLVASTEVDGPAQGAVGFASGGAGAGQTDFRFDNFIVYKP